MIEKIFVCTILLRRQKLYLQALKAIALLRVGRQDESVKAIKDVLASHPGDQATLQACTMYYKENGECESMQIVIICTAFVMLM